MSAQEAVVKTPHIVRSPVRIPVAPSPPIPPLEAGDRLTRYEFERRYKAMPHVKKAELIEGVVYVPTPVHFTRHAEPHSHVIIWLGTYCITTPGVRLGDNATVRLDLDNEIQPDALLRLEPEMGGHSCISEDDFIEGPPELIFEVASTSASYDLHDKFNVYRRNRVQEYAVWRVYDNQVDWWEWEEGEYRPLLPGDDGVIRSRVFPGLWLDVEALLTGDLARVLAVLQKGLETEEHAAFVKRLEST